MDEKFKNLVQDVLSEEEIANVVGGLMNPPKYGCDTGVCYNSDNWAAHCNSAVCRMGA